MNRASDPRLVKWFSVSALAFALLSMGILLGVLLGNLRHPESASATPGTAPGAVNAAPAAGTAPGTPVAEVAGSAAAAPIVADVPVSFDVHPWGEILIDGRPTGVTPPLTQVQVPVGRHHIEIRHANSPAWQTDVDALGSSTIHIEHTFAP